MYCNKCGKKLEADKVVCSYCGNVMTPTMQQQSYTNPLERIDIPDFNKPQTPQTSQIKSEEPQLREPQVKKQEKKPERKPGRFTNLKLLLLGSGIGLAVVTVMFTFIASNTSVGEYYFSRKDNTIAKEIEEQPEDPESSPTSSPSSSGNKKKKSKTAIKTENQYTFEYTGSITEADAKELIVEDSEKQKEDNSKEITEVENKFIKDYDITAANLLEMDPEFADDLTKVFDKIYKEYPKVRGYITNITLWNATQIGLIAAYQPLFPFATAETSTELPAIFKMRVLLSSKYFIKQDSLKKTVEKNEKAGWFPKNCDIYSPVAHELGHYISFLAMMNKYNIDSVLIATEDNFDTIIKLIDDFDKGEFSLELLEEAFDNYKKDNPDGIKDFDEWRGKISGYALAEDNEGDYIYDETVAEAFHDVYLNGDDANIASQYIVEVLKEKLRK